TNVTSALAKPARLVLFSCHGRWNARDPWSGAGFYLAGADDQPNLPLSKLLAGGLSGCALAVLSACESGMIEPTDTAEDYVGLPTALLVAGAASVVGSLWIVDDASAALLVTRALRNVGGSGRFAPSRGLYEAQLWLRTATLEQAAAAIQSMAPSREIA